jgi:AcrR family transcriptional regulator
MFGKPGRPPEDRDRRCAEIYAAVAPLLLARGVRRLNMRDAAAAACLSIGGLYHYFPDKRALARWPLTSGWIEHQCVTWYANNAQIRGTDALRFVNAFVDSLVGYVAFARPAVLAASDLGAQELLTALDTVVNTGIEQFAAALRDLVGDGPHVDTAARGMRRLVGAAVVDRGLDEDQLKAELHLLVQAAAQSTYAPTRSVA